MSASKRQISVADGQDGAVLTNVRVVADADRLEVTITNPDAVLPQVKETVEAETENLTKIVTLDGRVAWLIASITDRLRADGFVVEDTLVGDLTLNFEMDLRSGTLLGRAQPMLSDQSANQTQIPRDIHIAIARSFAKGGQELASKLETLVAISDHDGAVAAVADGLAKGVLAARNPKLLILLWSIDLRAVPAEKREAFLDTRLAVSAHHGRHDLAETDARAILGARTNLNPSRLADLENVIAIAASRRGETETALSIWRRLTRASDALDAETRAWIWRNLSLELPLKSTESAQAAKHSADAFLEAGDKRQAVTSLMRLLDVLEQQKPGDIIEQLDAAHAMIDQHGLMGDELRAAGHHIRGNRLRELGRHHEALLSAEEAIRLRDGVLGVEEQLISSLHLAVFEAKAVGDAETAGRYEIRARELETETGSTYFALARRIEGLLKEFNADEAAALSFEAEATDQPRLIGAVGVAIFISDPSIDDETRLGRLEALHGRLGSMAAKNDDLHPIQHAIASVLRRLGQHDRVAIWCRRILNAHPMDFAARQALLSALWALGAWAEAAIYLKDEIERVGEAPGLLYAYGRSLFEAGDLSGAVTALTKSLRLNTGDKKLCSAAEEFRSRALDLGGTLIVQAATLPKAPVLREEVEAALWEFAKFVSGAKRMRFWTRDVNDHKWVDRPEGLAQDLLHTYFKAHFKQRVALYEEVDAGPGRLDLLLQLDGGLSIIIELKMCGYGYSSTYAASGEDQIRAYMDAHNAHLGYLVVFDSRLLDCGATLLAGLDMGLDTVREFFIDLRPRVPKRSVRRRSPIPHIP